MCKTFFDAPPTRKARPKINLKTKNPEFLEWKWIDIDKITEKVVDFKLHVYEKIKTELEDLV